MGPTDFLPLKVAGRAFIIEKPWQGCDFSKRIRKVEDEVHETWNKARHLLYRMINSDLPSDLMICIDNITYLLHKFPLLQKSGLLQQRCSERGETGGFTVDLHDIPGGSYAFELCAKFCYGIKIDLSAHNIVSAICAAKFLLMTESVREGNFVSKLEVFFDSYILEGWKDSVVALETTERHSEWSENLGIIRRCIDSVVDKILTHASKEEPQVCWTYTYTRPGYAHRKRHKSAPKDWWTEDIADLNIDIFRCIIITLRSTNMLPPQLIGEALHVYTCRWLPGVTESRPDPETSTTSQMTQEESVNRVKQLEIIVSLIPEDKGSVSVGFLIRLLSIAKFLGASPVIRTHLIKKCSLQLKEAKIDDLTLPLHESSSNNPIYDTELVEAVLEGFVTQWRKLYSSDEQSLHLIIKVGRLVDSYLQVISTDANMSVQKVMSLAKTLPEFAPPEHDKLYKAINIYLNEHPQMSKDDKKRLCSILDCQKLSDEACAHAIRNDKLPLRNVVQILFFEQEKHGGKALSSRGRQQIQLQPQRTKPREITMDSQKLLQQSSKADDAIRRSGPKSTSQMLEPESESESEQKSRKKRSGKPGHTRQWKKKENRNIQI